jgi:phage tail sheath protein FI
MPGEGTVIWGDRTMYKANSAFAKINVRTLFIVLKKTISKSAKYLLFEINDSITQLLFRNSTIAYLERVQSERGIYDKRVVCDETNNNAAVLDAEEFVASILVKPARTISTVRLNFVAVGNSVNFSELE